MTTEDVKEEVFQSVDFDEPDDPEAEQKVDSDQQEAPDLDVVAEQIVPSKTFQIYAGKVFDSSSSYLPEQVFATSHESESNFESPLQKYRRLKQDITGFQQDLEQIVARANKEQKDPAKELTQQLSKDLNNLFSSVEDFQTNPQLAQLFLDSNQSVLNSVDPNYLFKRLEAFQAQKTAKQADRAVFTLYNDGTVNNKNHRLQEIEQRVNAMEKVLGPAPEKTVVGPMMRSVEYLTKRLDLLSDNTKLQSLERRAEVLRKKLQEITAKAHSTIELQITKTKEEKIERLFNMMNRWDEVATQLPAIIRRMQSVANLHEESANVVNKVSQLDVQTKIINTTLQTNQKKLSTLHTNLNENNTIMINNLKTIQERIQNLEAKVTELKQM